MMLARMGLFSYLITGGNDDHYFTIHSSDGIITAEPGIDRELNERFELTITARDGGRPPPAQYNYSYGDSEGH